MVKKFKNRRRWIFIDSKPWSNLNLISVTFLNVVQDFKKRLVSLFESKKFWNLSLNSVSFEPSCFMQALPIHSRMDSIFNVTEFLSYTWLLSLLLWMFMSYWYHTAPYSFSFQPRFVCHVNVWISVSQTLLKVNNVGEIFNQSMGWQTQDWAASLGLGTDYPDWQMLTSILSLPLKGKWRRLWKNSEMGFLLERARLLQPSLAFNDDAYCRWSFGHVLPIDPVNLCVCVTD